MADSEARKIIGNLWASGGTAEREDPETESLDGRVLNIIEGWTSTYSVPDGDRLRRKVWNQLFRQLDGGASDSMLGLQVYDENIDYPQNAQVSVGVNTYRALLNNGPTIGNVTSPVAEGQMIWEILGSVAKVPDTPLNFRVTAGNGQLNFFWGCGRDNGSVVTGFVFEWRRVGNNVWTEVALTQSFHRLSNLENGISYEGRVQAVNALGNSIWSSILTGMPRADVPDQVIGVVGTSGQNGQVPVRWEEPNNGGSDIIRYILQWRRADQAFNSIRQVAVSANAYTVLNVTNEVRIFVRVQAENTAGRGVWSRESSAIPRSPPPPPDPIPINTVPNAVAAAPTGLALGVTGILWDWPIPLAGTGKEQAGGQIITGFDAQWRVAGNTWTGNILQVTSACLVQTDLNSGQTYELRVRPRNVVGVGRWSPIGRTQLNVDRISTLTGQVSGTSIDWLWSAVEGATGYEHQTRQRNGSWAGVTVTGLQRNTSGHTPGFEVEGRVRAIVGTKTGPWKEATVFFVPAAPSNVRLVKNSRALYQLIATWSDSEDGGLPILDYEVRFRSRGTFSDFIQNVSGRRYFYNQRNPIRGAPLRVQVRSRNAVGYSPWSSYTSFVQPLKLPSAVRINSSQTWQWPWNFVAKATLTIVGGAGEGGHRGERAARLLLSSSETDPRRPKIVTKNGKPGRPGESTDFVNGGNGGLGGLRNSDPFISPLTRLVEVGEGGRGGVAGQPTKVTFGSSVYIADGGGGGGGGGGASQSIAIEFNDVPPAASRVFGNSGQRGQDSGNGRGGRGERAQTLSPQADQLILGRNSDIRVFSGIYLGARGGAGGDGSSGQNRTQEITGLTTQSQLRIVIGAGGGSGTTKGQDGYVIITPKD